MELLAENYNKKPVIVYEGAPEMGGRFAYNESVTGFNYRAERRIYVTPFADNVKRRTRRFRGLGSRSMSDMAFVTVRNAPRAVQGAATSHIR